MEVHAPEHPIHTWRDFFIHIATIVVGLLIAIGLEQTVEWLHHVHERREIRETLRREREANIEYFRTNVYETRRITAMLENDMRVLIFLKQHPGTTAKDLPGILVWPSVHVDYATATFQSAQQTGILALLPRDEAEDIHELYLCLKGSDDAYDAYYETLKRAYAFLYTDEDPSHLTPAQIDREIDLMQQVLSANGAEAINLWDTSRIYPDFSPSLSVDEIRRMNHYQPLGDLEKKWGSKAYQYLQHDVDAADRISQQSGLEKPPL